MTIHGSIRDNESGKFVDVDEAGPAVRVTPANAISEAVFRSEMIEGINRMNKLLELILNHQRQITGIESR